MKKINNKFRNNNNIYSLNYKFDSICSAGKFSGTALDLIKKYNELAKEAHSNGDYVEMEVFRQYAEHYRKIVTEINERKNLVRDNTQNTENQPKEAEDNVENANDNVSDEQPDSTQPVQTEQEQSTSDSEQMTETKVRKRRSFKIVDLNKTQEEISQPQEDNIAESTEIAPKPKRVIHRRAKASEE